MLRPPRYRCGSIHIRNICFTTIKNRMASIDPPHPPNYSDVKFSKMLQKTVRSYRSSAKTLTGPPEPPSSLIGATTRNAPVSGNPLKSARFSR